MISKKIDNSAVARNRMRRLLSTFMGENWEMLRSSQDMIIFVQKTFKVITVDEKEELTSGLIAKGVFSEKTTTL